MKNRIVLFLIFSTQLIWAQTKPVRIVFDITSKDTLTHQAALRHVKGMADAYPDAMLEVVIYGSAWPMAVNGYSAAGKDVQALAGNDRVSFKVCGITLDRFKVERSKLLSGVDVVPDAIMEIVTKQGAGWAYIKESQN
jgi:intracellular sulfur oxidation DsrE/DsrF family protein